MSNVDLLASKFKSFVSRYRNPLFEAVAVWNEYTQIYNFAPPNLLPSVSQEQDEGDSGDPYCSGLAQEDVVRQLGRAF